jgi:hypothetical protein
MQENVLEGVFQTHRLDYRPDQKADSQHEGDKEQVDEKDQRLAVSQGRPPLSFEMLPFFLFYQKYGF